MKFVIVSLHGWNRYEFYLQTKNEFNYSDIKKRVVEVVQIKHNLPEPPDNVTFGVTAPFDDPRKDELIDKDLWVIEPTITLATPASSNKHIAKKTFVELRELAREVITQLNSMEDQNTSIPVRESSKEYTAATIVAELENLTNDGLNFLNDWLLNEMQGETVRMEKAVGK